MLKPHVMQPPVRKLWADHRLHLAAMPLIGAGAAGFARSIMGRFGAEREDLYPDSWLVLRQQEEQETQQQLQQNQLTQLTLRLAIQFSQNFLAGKSEPTALAGSSPKAGGTEIRIPLLGKPAQKNTAEHSAMERQVLLQTLTYCLTTLEKQDRETVREVRQLLYAAAQTETTPAGKGKRMRAAASEEKLQSSTVKPSVSERKLLHQHMAGQGAKADPLEQERLERFHLLRTTTSVTENMALPPEAVRNSVTAVTRRLETKLEHVTRETETLLRRSKDIAENTKIIDFAGTRKQNHLSEKQALYQQKKRLIDLITTADPEEQERVWALTTESTELAVRYQRSFQNEEHLESREKLIRVIRELNREEYSQLVTMLAKELPAVEKPSELPSVQTGERKQLVQAGPILNLISQVLGQKRIVRESLWKEIQGAPKEAAEAFLSLAKASGIIRIAKSEKEISITEEQQLEQVIRKARRSELAELSQRLTRRISELHEEERQLSHSREESTAMVQLKRLLTTRNEERIARIRTRFPELPEDERKALSLAAAEALEQTAAETTGDRPTAPTDRDPLVYLLERSTDPVETARKLSQSQPIRELEQQRALDRTILMRLNSFTQARGGHREQQVKNLLSGLDQAGGERMLKRLETGKLLSEEAETPRTRPVKRLEELLTFRTQKEYKSFRYHLNEYLKQVELPEVQAGTTLVRWLQEQKRTERQELRQTIEHLTHSRPEAWKQALHLTRSQHRDEKIPHPEQELVFRAVTERGGPVYQRLTRLLAENKLAPGVVESSLNDLKQALPVLTPIVSTTKLIQAQTIRIQEAAKARERSLSRGHEMKQTPRALNRLDAQPPVYRKTTSPIEQLEPALAQIRQLAAKRAERIGLAGQKPVALTGQLHHNTASLDLIQQHRTIHQTNVFETKKQHEDLYQDVRELTTAHRSSEERHSSSYWRDSADMVTEHRIKTTEQRLHTTAERRLIREDRQSVEQTYQGGERGLKYLQPVEQETPQILTERYIRPAAELVQARLMKQPAERPSRERWALPRATRARPLQPALSALASGTEEPEFRYEGRGEILELRREKPRQSAQTVEQTAARSAELIVEKQAPQLQLLRRQDQEQAQVLERQEQDMNELRKQLAQQEALVKKALERDPVQRESPVQVKTLAKAVMKELEGQLRLERQRRGLS